MKVTRLVSPYRNTNNYLIEIAHRKFIGIDIGNIKAEVIQKFIADNGAELLGWFLTHAHADHCIGINQLYEHFEMPIYCSLQCAKEISDSRKNFSFYSDEIPTFEYHLPFSILSDNEIRVIEKIEITSFHVPGHSSGCMAFGINKYLFTGDFLMREHKTPLNFPNSNKRDYANSLKKIISMNSNFECYYSGHGESFNTIFEVVHLEY